MLWWQSVEQAFLTAPIELIQEANRPALYRRTMSTVSTVTIYTMHKTKNDRFDAKVADY